MSKPEAAEAAAATGRTGATPLSPPDPRASNGRWGGWLSASGPGDGWYLPLVVLLLVGIALRLLAMAAYSSVVTDYFPGDAGRFIRAGYPGLFEDEWQPSGYPAALLLIRTVTDAVWVTVALQHVIGLVTGLVLYATCRRAGLARRLSVMPAGVVLLNGDHLFLEQSFLAESFWMLLLALSVYAAVRATQGRHAGWAIAAGIAMGMSVVVRNVSLPLVGLLAVWLLFAVEGPRLKRMTRSAAAAASGVTLVLAYSLTATSLGSYSGLGEMSGWSLYSRVGQFADCTQFTPPPGTAGLCPTTPPAERAGHQFWYFDPRSPARTALPGLSPKESPLALAFSSAAILGQPTAYARTVAKDFIRYFDPHAGFDRELSGSDPESMSFRVEPTDPAGSAEFAGRVRTKYSGVDATPESGTAWLATWQAVTRLSGLPLLGLVALSLIACVVVRGKAAGLARLATALGISLLALPVAVTGYEARYVIPAAMLLAVAAAAGLAQALDRTATPAPADSDRAQRRGAGREHSMLRAGST